jgi:hypothetical protein
MKSTVYSFARIDSLRRRCEPAKNLCPLSDCRSYCESRYACPVAERTRLETRLTGIRNRMDAAYVDKLDGKIPVDFWERKMSEWRMEEQQVKMAIHGLSAAEAGDRALDAQRIFELANKAYSLYVSQNPVEKAKLLKMLFSNCSIDAVSVTPTYRKPFDMIFKRAHLEEWSALVDDFRTLGPFHNIFEGPSASRDFARACMT